MKTKLAATGGAAPQTYVDDVFSTYLYTGNGATQTITNGIDLAGKGGLVWQKCRSTAQDHHLWDTLRGVSKSITSNNTTAQYDYSALGSKGVTAFNSNGFDINGNAGDFNSSTDTYASWTFRKAAKFFDVVTYTGDGVNGRAIPHNLGVAPGMIIVKSTTNATNWITWNKSLSVPTNKALYLNGTQAELTSAYFPTLPTSSVFYTNGSGYDVNTTGQTYVAYLFAHDTSSTGIIQCGSFTTDGSGNATVNLGWEPQWLMQKSTGTGRWEIEDTMRGWNRSFVAELMPNLSNAEETANGAYFTPTATGFTTIDSGLLLPSVTYIYMAIRRPNKPPTSGTQVYNAIARTGTGAAATVTGVGFAPDMLISENKSSPEGWMANRLAAFSNTVARYLFTPYTSAETAVTSATSGVMLDGATTGTVSLTAGANLNSSGQLYVDWFFKRASGFFDVVCYTGAVGYQDLSHNLGAVPELVIIKNRTGTGQNWIVGLQGITGTSKYLVLNSTAGIVSDINYFGSTWTSTKVLVDGNQNPINQSGYTYVMYLFATLAGISKVGSYTGNGTSQNINCGFAAGARFFLVKATSTTGSWWIWDSARGITAGNDPALQLNSIAAEITTANAVDPYSPGIIVNQEATCSINASGVSYVYLAIS